MYLIKTLPCKRPCRKGERVPDGEGHTSDPSVGQAQVYMASYRPARANCPCLYVTWEYIQRSWALRARDGSEGKGTCCTSRGPKLSFHIYIKQFTTAYNSSYREWHSMWPLWASTHTWHSHKCTNTQLEPGMMGHDWCMPTKMVSPGGLRLSRRT